MDDDPPDDRHARDNVVENTRREPVSFLCFQDMNSSQEVLLILLSIFAVFGSTLRIYLARIFGLDCEFPPPDNGNYLKPISTCLTASGLSDQSGGALFIDLPANMIGSFLMGLMTPDDDEIAALPWLGRHHRLQQHINLHHSLRIAFCGSLTTFASWNTQMVTMIIGAEASLGSQVVSGIFGYILGIVCSISSYRFGKNIAVILHLMRHHQKPTATPIDHDADLTTYESNADNIQSEPSGAVNDRPTSNLRRLSNYICLLMVDVFDFAIHSKYSSIVLFIALIAFLIVGHFAIRTNFHKSLLICALLGPPGTIIRWKLSSLNGKWSSFPLGTFIANLSASIISIICTAISSRFSVNTDSISSFWLTGIKSGFAGNLSTVSTFAKELVLLTENEKGPTSYIYGFLSIFVCCISSLVLYALIIYI